MPILIKLIQAIVLGLLMIFSVMLLIVAGAAIVGFIAEMFGFTSVAEASQSVQRTVWLRTKKWFFRYKEY